MVFVLVRRSRRVVPDELVTLTSWDARDFLIFLVMVGWKGKDRRGRMFCFYVKNILSDLIIVTATK